MKLRLAMALAFAAAIIGSASAEINLNGAGATFPNPIYQKWFSEYHNTHQDVQINYQSIGSGGGIQQYANTGISEQTLCFAGNNYNDCEAQNFNQRLQACLCPANEPLSIRSVTLYQSRNFMARLQSPCA